MKRGLSSRWRARDIVVLASLFTLTGCQPSEVEEADALHEADFYPGVSEMGLDGGVILTFQDGVDGYAGCQTVNINPPTWGDGNGPTYGDSYYGSPPYNSMCVGDDMYGAHSLIRFDGLQGALPPGWRVASADLTFTGVNHASVAVSAIVDVLAEAWEPNPSPTPAVVGWRYRLPNVEWSARGADGPGSRMPNESAQITAPAYIAEMEVIVNLDPALVEEWLTGAEPHDGFLVRNIPGQQHLGVHASMHPTVSRRPRLRVGIQSGAPNQPPTASITSPANNASFNEHDGVVVQMAGSDPDGTLTRMRLFDNDIQVCEAVAAPYSCALADISAGSHALKARAFDSSGAWTDSEVVTIMAASASGQGAQSVTVTLQQGLVTTRFPGGYQGTTDGEIKSDIFPYNGNDGSTSMSGDITLINGGADNVAHGLLRFSLAGTGCSVIEGAALTLWVISWNSGNAVRLYHLAAPWDVAGETIGGPGSTFGWTHSGDGNNWPAAGALAANVVKSFGSPITAQQALTANGVQELTFALSVGEVQSWLSGANHGLVMESVLGGSSYATVLGSENAAQSRRPKLVLTCRS
jgi:hypothetical protein